MELKLKQGVNHHEKREQLKQRAIRERISVRHNWTSQKVMESLQQSQGSATSLQSKFSHLPISMTPQVTGEGENFRDQLTIWEHKESADVAQGGKGSKPVDQQGNLATERGAPVSFGLAEHVMNTVQCARKHHTKGGKIKDTTIDYLESDKLTLERLATIWEDVHSVLDAFAYEDTTPLPANTTLPTYGRGRPKVLDLGALRERYYKLASIMENGLVRARTQSRGGHGNDEEKLPVYNQGVVGNYEEFGYLKKGARLVVDHNTNPELHYVSLHYSTFYRVMS